MALQGLIRYFGRKPQADMWIKRYSRSKEVILDPFGGAGTIVLEAVKLGRRAIYADLNPYIVIVLRTLVKALAESSIREEELFKLGKELLDKRKKIPVKRYDGNISWISRDSLYKIGPHTVYYVVWHESKPLVAKTVDGKIIEVPSSWKDFPFMPYHPYPKDKIWYERCPFFTRRNADYIHEFFTSRNLVALATLFYDCLLYTSPSPRD